MDSVILFLLSGGFVLVIYLIRSLSYQNRTLFKAHSSLLVVIAHPDDECMFFGPVITSLVESGVNVHILCLSAGNYYGQSHVRSQEFINSCTALGVKESNCQLVDDPRLPDHPRIEWDEECIIGYISQYITQYNVSALLTFDKLGVSGHSNHISIYQAVSKHRWPHVIPYQLITVSLFRKYISVFDLFIAKAKNENIFYCSFSSMAKPYKAMFLHKSQLMWFRYLYLMFSRYMIFNSIEEI